MSFSVCVLRLRDGAELYGGGHNGDNEVRDNNEHNQHLQASRVDYI